MRGKHHYKVILVTIYDDRPSTRKVLFQTNKRAIAELYANDHDYLAVNDSDYFCRYLKIQKDY